MEDKTKRVVIIAMDGSEYASKAFQWYLTEIHREDDHVILTYVVDHRRGYTYGSIWVPTDASLLAQAYTEEEHKAKAVVDKLKALLKDAKVEGEVCKASGDPGHRIVEKAEETGARLIITGSRGLGTIRRTLIGSVSDFILHHASVPVLICKH